MGAIFGTIAIVLGLVAVVFYLIEIVKNGTPFMSWKTTVAIVCFLACFLFASIGAIVNQKTCLGCEQVMHSNFSYCPNCGTEVKEWEV